MRKFSYIVYKGAYDHIMPKEWKNDYLEFDEFLFKKDYNEYSAEEIEEFEERLSNGETITVGDYMVRTEEEHARRTGNEEFLDKIITDEITVGKLLGLYINTDITKVQSIVIAKEHRTIEAVSKKYSFSESLLDEKVKYFTIKVLYNQVTLYIYIK